MKTVVAVLVTAVISAGGAHAYDAAISPAAFASLQARVVALEAFNRNCLRAYRLNLTESSNGVMVWGIGPPTTHAGRFYGIPATAVPHWYC